MGREAGYCGRRMSWVVLFLPFVISFEDTRKLYLFPYSLFSFALFLFSFAFFNFPSIYIFFFSFFFLGMFSSSPFSLFTFPFVVDSNLLVFMSCCLHWVLFNLLYEKYALLVILFYGKKTMIKTLELFSFSFFYGVCFGLGFFRCLFCFVFWSGLAPVFVSSFSSWGSLSFLFLFSAFCLFDTPWVGHDGKWRWYLTGSSEKYTRDWIQYQDMKW